VSQVIVTALMLTGTALMLVASIGVLRMPDLFTRMQATTKAASLGVGLLLIAAAVHFGDTGVTTRVLAATAFILLTTPIAAHLIGRAAYFLGVPLWEGSVRDELRSHLDQLGHAETSGQPPAPPAREERAESAGDEEDR
jgi:multicomponent Na+:H+ antiporter subunit G